jgi:predicted HTH transcriptional regulator
MKKGRNKRGPVIRELKIDLCRMKVELRELSRKSERMAGEVEELKRALHHNGSGRTVREELIERGLRPTVMNIIFEEICKSQGGVKAALLSLRTGFNTRKIHRNLSLLKKKGLIRSLGKGIYEKV